MLTGIIVGLVISLLLVGVIVWFVMADTLYWWQILLLAFGIIFVAILICGFIGYISDVLYFREYIATWDINKTTYEQAIQAYGDYESIVKNNPELIKEAIAKNAELAKRQYEATCWWNWYLDDSIANLQPINIGTN